MFRQFKGVLLHKTSGVLVAAAVSAFLLTSAVLVDGQNTRSSKAARQGGKASRVSLDSVEVESFSGAVRLRWKTGYESSIVGFRLWRESNGERTQVGDGLIGGSVASNATGVFEAGNEYMRYDRGADPNAYYWMEVVDGFQRSRWYGPFFQQPNFNPEEAEIVARDLASLDAADKGGLTEIVAPVARSSAEPFAANDFASYGPGNVDVATDLAANSNALKIGIKRKGIYRLSAATLASYGFNAANSANWRLYVGGVEQAMTVNTDGSIEFYATAVDTRQTDTNVYWLVSDSVAGRRITRAAQSFVKNARYASTRVAVERRDKINPAPSVLNGDRDNTFGQIVNTTPLSQTVTLSDISSENVSATVGVDLQGLTTITHSVSVRLNGVSIGTISLAAVDRIEWSVNVPLSRLVVGNNTITLQSLNGTSDMSLVEAVRISFPRLNRARNDRVEFTLPAGASQSYLIKGFTSADVRVFDITTPSAVSEVSSISRLDTDGTYMVTLSGSSSARQYLAIAGAAQIYDPASLEVNSPSTLTATSNGARMVVVGPAEFGPTLQQFVAQRTSEGISTRFVAVEDIYDEFGGGVVSTDALKAFFQYAKNNWTVKPSYVMIAGDASNDPRNYVGFGGPSVNRVPTILVDTWNMETGSDESLVDFNNDGVGEIAIGRLPARNTTELQAMLDKVLSTAPLTLTELRSRGATFVSDGPIGYDFANGSRTMSTYMPSGVPVGFVDAGGQDPATVRGNIVNNINGGPGIVNYFGHGTTAAWSSAQYLRTIDASSMLSSTRKPFVAMIDCLNGYYLEGAAQSIAEAVIKQPNGGASAVWASTGYNGAYEQEYMQRDFYQKAFTGMALGDAARQTKMIYANIDLRRTYILFGDPSQPLVR